MRTRIILLTVLLSASCFAGTQIHTGVRSYGDNINATIGALKTIKGENLSALAWGDIGENTMSVSPCYNVEIGSFTLGIMGGFDLDFEAVNGEPATAYGMYSTGIFTALKIGSDYWVWLAYHTASPMDPGTDRSNLESYAIGFAIGM